MDEFSNSPASPRSVHDDLPTAAKSMAMPARFHKRWIALLSYVLVFWASLGIVVGSLGFPMPAPRAAGAFPCQGHGCGCADAETCWFGCCCLTPAQRLAWAEENDITPPEAFLATYVPEEASKKPNASNNTPHCCAPLTLQEAETSSHDASRATCCSSKTVSCCSSQISCCSSKINCDSCTECEREQCDSDESPPADCPCIGAKRCGGPAPHWIAGGQHLGMPLRRTTLEHSGWQSPITIWEPCFEADRDSPPTRPG